MLNRIYNKVNRLTTPRNNWCFGLAALALSIIMLVARIPDKLAEWMGYAGGPGMFGPDAGVFSNPDALYSTLATYSDTGRRVYIYNSLLFDLAYPLCYGLALALLLNGVTGRLFGESSRWRQVSLLPL